MPRRPAYCGPSWCHDSRVNTTHTSATQTCEHFDFHDDDADEDFEGFSQERISERIGDQGVDVPVPQNLEERFEESTQELIIEQIGDQIVDVPVPQIMPEIIEVGAPAPVIEYVAPAVAGEGPSSWKRHLARPVFFFFGEEETKWMKKCAGIRSAGESGSKLHTTTATPAQRGESRVGPHVTEGLLHQPHGRLGAPASSLPLLWPPCRPTVNPIGGAMPALPVCAAVCFRHERVL